jgi:hypothetical protein
MDEPPTMRLPDDITFDQWVAHVFDHPVVEPQWWFSSTAPYWNELAVPARALEFVTQLFREPEFLLQRFTPAQIDQGLNYLVSPAGSSHMRVLLDESLPWESRRACFDAMIMLYGKLLGPMNGDTLGHLQQPGSPAVPNFACYMWWDVILINGGMEHNDRDRINEAVLHVFETVLRTMTSEACLESVLHGLGHWQSDMPDRVEAIVGRFLQRTDISDDLRSYAEDAADGMVQ